MDETQRSGDRAPSIHRAEYVARVNRVIDHIERNLDRPLALAELAELTHLSRFHFHRVFSAMVGETLHRFVLRLRLEKAARMLVSNPDSSILAIALDCGFSSSATFARAFKAGFGMTGSQWRHGGHRQVREDDRKIRKHVRNACNAPPTSTCYIDPKTAALAWRLEMQTEDPLSNQPLKAEVTVQDLPVRNVAYLRHVGPYGQVAVIPGLVQKLRRWAGARGLRGPQTVELIVAHDSPNVTDDAKLRLSVCTTVPPGTATDGEVGTMEVPGGKFGVARFEIPPARIAEAWAAMMGGWLPDSGYRPDERLSYEVFHNTSAEHPQGTIVLDICVPIRPL